MAAYLEVDAYVAKIKSGRIYLKVDLIVGREIVLSVAADNAKVTGGLTFAEGQPVTALVEGNRILKITPL